MPKDFAGRGRQQGAKQSKQTRPKKKQTRRRASPKSAVIFHGPSFSFGAVIGAGVILFALYAPDFLGTSGADRPVAREPEPPKPAMRFEFPDLLKESNVSVDPEPYAVPEPDPAAEPASFSIQAASFRNEDEADRLRASLLLRDLPATTEGRRVDGERWYRVVVGPFERRVEAERAMTALREQRLSAIWLNNHN